uniref:Uncharacterized protein n=1 Tax=Opuntia streptacantha TaxID=393608 RepID=A0A7C9A9W6_OPUST
MKQCIECNRSRNNIRLLHNLPQTQSFLQVPSLTMPINKRIISNLSWHQLSLRHFIKQLAGLSNSLLFTQPTNQNVIDKHINTDPSTHKLQQLKTPLQISQLHSTLHSLSICKLINPNTRIQNFIKQLKTLAKLLSRYQTIHKLVKRVHDRK